MHNSPWAAMTKRHRGRQWHCRIILTFNLDYVSPSQAMQWPDDRSKHIRQWLGCGNSIPRYVFPLLRTWWALLGAPKTSRDWKKDCGKPGCPNDDVIKFPRLPLMAQPGHAEVVRRHPLLEVERTCRSSGPTSEFDPK